MFFKLFKYHLLFLLLFTPLLSNELEKEFYSQYGLDVEFLEFKIKMDTTDKVVLRILDYGLSNSSLIIGYGNDNNLIALLTNFFKQLPLDSFIQKKIDDISIFLTNEIYTLDKLGIKYNVFNPLIHAIKFYDLNLFTNRNEFNINKERVEKTLDVTKKGWEYTLNHKEEAVNLILTNIYPIRSMDLQHLKITVDSNAQLNFTNKQESYLKTKDKMRICISRNFHFLNENRPLKFLPYYMKSISKKIKTPLEIIITTSLDESIEKLKKNECDFLFTSEHISKTLENVNFTTQYLSEPLVILTKETKYFIRDLYNIRNKKIAIVKNYSTYEILKNKYPDINFVEVNSIGDGLMMLKSGKIFAFIGVSSEINKELLKESNNKLNISGQLNQSFFLKLGSRSDEIVLNEILERTLYLINNELRDQSTYNLHYINGKEKIDYKTIVIIVVAFIIIILIIIYWNLKFKNEINNIKIVEEKLRQSEKNFRVLFDIAPILLNQFDKNGKILFWNKECEKVFGYKFDEIKKMDNPLEFLYPNPEIREKVIQSFENKEGIYKEWYPLTKNGNKITTIWANIELPNKDIINFGFDITKQKKDELLLKQAKEELEKLNNSLEDKIKKEIEKNTQFQITLMEQNKLAQMGEMIENIAHQWRQPLAEINSTVLLLDAILIKNSSHNEIIESKLLQIEELTEYMSKTINDFKNFFEINKKKENINLYKSFEDSLIIIKGRLSLHRIKVDLNVNKRIHINSYSSELKQVFLVIFNNSIDALIKNKISNPIISIYIEEEINEIVIFIEDNGRGINKGLLNKIFEPYFTTKHKSQGTGLGLYISKMIIEKALNGSILAENINSGIRFEISLPKGKKL